MTATPRRFIFMDGRILLDQLQIAAVVRLDTALRFSLAGNNESLYVTYSNQKDAEEALDEIHKLLCEVVPTT